MAALRGSTSLTGHSTPIRSRNTPASVVTTVVVTALFVVASNYFKSERIVQTFELIDRNEPEEE